MPVLTEIVKIGVYLMMAVSIFAALGAVLFPNIFHASLALIVTLIGIAGIFVALHAEFLAGVQLLLYVGAVMTLVIFAIMMTERLSDKQVPQQNKLQLPALSGAIIFLMTLIGIIYATPWPVKNPLPARVDTAALGRALLTEYVFPFEVISVFLIAALIGALVVARREK
jgi:NADH-quinone oxidoreductase subunit J